MIRRALTVIGALAASLLLALGSAVAADAASVRIVDRHGDSSTVDLGEIGNPDVNAIGYAVRSGSGTDTETVTGFSVRKVLDAAAEGESGIDNFSFTYAEISRPSGGDVTLMADQVRDGVGFDDGPAVVYEKGSAAAFLRPSTGSGDLNASDVFSTSGTLEIRLRSGTPIAVTGTASKAKIEAGERVAFTATVSGAPSGTNPVISWSFGDGKSASGATVSHTFKRECTCNVVVSAKVGDVGPSDVIPIQVGKPKEKGPDRQGGGEDRDEDAGGGLTDGSGGTEGGTGTGAGSGGRETPGGGRDAPSDHRSDRGRGENGGERVVGELLSGETAGEAEAAAADEEAKAATARTGTPSDESGMSVPGGAIATLIVGALLAGGAAGESGRFAIALGNLRRRFGV